jgi:hypothetical protein
MTTQELETLSIAIAKMVKAAIHEKLAPVLDRVVALEDRPATLRYCGVFDPADTYAENEAVSHDGSLWIARESTKGQRPGSGLAWQLAIKHARPRR